MSINPSEIRRNSIYRDNSASNLNNSINVYHNDSLLDISDISIFHEKPIDVFNAEEIEVNFSIFQETDDGIILSPKQKLIRICANIFITIEIKSSGYFAKILSVIFKSVIVLSVVSYLASVITI